MIPIGVPMDTQKALEWLSEVLAVQDRTLTLQDTRSTVAEWDSLGSLLLLSRLEEDLKIVISTDEVAAMSTIQEIYELMEKNNAFCAD